MHSLKNLPRSCSLDEDYLRYRWKEFNRLYFSNTLSGPHIRMEGNGHYSGQFIYVPGQPSEIRINSVLATFANAQTCLDNTLLHEMVHQYVEEVEGGDEWAHGLKFFTVANRLGAELNLSFCSQDRLGDWPDHVDAMLASFQDFSAAKVLHSAPFYWSVPQCLVKMIPSLAGRISQRLKRTGRWPSCLW